MIDKVIWASALRGFIGTTAAAAIIIAALAPAGAQTVDKGKHMIDGVRDARYCEIIPVARRGLRLVGTVYNTLGLNDCPPALWDKITEDAMRKRFRAIMVVLNGPRHFVMDAIGAEGDTATGATVDAGGLALTARATIKLRLADMRTKPYRERTVDRQTRYVFMAGRPVAGRRPLRHAVLRGDGRQVAVLRRTADARQPAQAARRLALRNHDAGQRPHLPRGEPGGHRAGRS